MDDEFAGQMSVVGTVMESEYNYTIRAIRAVLRLEDGGTLKVEIPYTHFTFREGMNIDVEMKKTSDLLPGNKIKVISTAQPKVSGLPGLESI